MPELVDLFFKLIGLVLDPIILVGKFIYSLILFFPKILISIFNELPSFLSYGLKILIGFVVMFTIGKIIILIKSMVKG